ncbi:MAG: hypothetical protein NVS4B3_28410 [Gemmatimonadaceae bacterium]
MNRTTRLVSQGAVAAVAMLAVIAPSAIAQFNLKINDSTNVRFGLLLQQWTDWNKTNFQPGGLADSSYAQNVFLRRIRFLAGGNITGRLGFFYEVDAANLGLTTSGVARSKNAQVAVFTQDAYGEYRLGDGQGALLDFGLILVPLCRNCLNSAASLLSLDYGTYSFVESPATQSVVGRDLGTQLRGYVLDQRLEYRVGLFQGVRNTAAANPFRSVGRLQYNFLSTEVAPIALTYAGTYFGKKPVFAVGAGYDKQQDYNAYSVDAFFDHPVGTDAVTLTANFVHYDGGTTFPTLLPSGNPNPLGIPKQDTYYVEGGYYFSALKLMPFGRYERRNADATASNNQKETRYQVGTTYYAQGHNFNVKAAYSRNSLDTFVGGVTGPTNDQNQFTVQLQAFVF